MSALLAIMGGLLVVVGTLWRLREVEAGATAGQAPAPGGGRSTAARRPSTTRTSRGVSGLKWASETGVAQSQVTASTAVAELLRRSDRILLRIPVEVSGIDLDGHPFTERTQTQVINRNGGSFALRSSLLPETQITVKNLQSGQTCRFRACQPVHDLPGGLREWGVECLDPAPTFWGITFADSPQETSKELVGSLLECNGCHCREMTKLSAQDYRAIVQAKYLQRLCTWCSKETNWKFAVVEGGVGGISTRSSGGAEVTHVPQVERRSEERRSARPLEERRREERDIARVPILIRHTDGREELTTSENASRSGVCCTAQMELAVGDRVFLKFLPGEGPQETEVPAVIMSRREFDNIGGKLYGMKLERG